MTRFRERLYLLAVIPLFAMTSSASAQTQQIPIDEYLAMADYGTYYECFWNPATQDVTVCLDNVGGRMAYFGLESDIAIEGQVMVRPMKDGRAHVTILMHTSNAVCWAFDGSPVVFGASPRQVYTNPTFYGPLLSFGSGLFRYEFTMPSVDTPVPPLWMLGTDDYPMESFIAEFSCKGLMTPASGYPAGTRGVAQVTQRALYGTGVPTGCPAGDCWPAEVAFYRVTGK